MSNSKKNAAKKLLAFAGAVCCCSDHYAAIHRGAGSRANCWSSCQSCCSATKPHGCRAQNRPDTAGNGVSRPLCVARDGGAAFRGADTRRNRWPVSSSAKQTTAGREVGHWLRSVGKDSHLGLELTVQYGEVTYIRHETDEKCYNNFAFEKLEILPGNIGYLKLNKFVQADAAFDVAAQALQILSRTDALIIDLRESAGGSPELVRYLLSHFLPADTLLWQLESRSAEQTEEVRAQVVLQKQLQMPLYVLQSANQVSAAEFFSYALQQQGRATVIGETSAGLAHYTGAMAVTDWLFVRIPLARPLFPKNADNFEQPGVEPDVKVPAAQALQQALKLTQH